VRRGKKSRRDLSLFAGGASVDKRPVTVTDATFAAEVERSPLPVQLDLWAPWRRPCQLLAPVIDELAVEMAGRVRVAKMNVDENPMTAGASMLAASRLCWRSKEAGKSIA
jgi:thioredoxin-like negative regulator of GroEL